MLCFLGQSKTTGDEDTWLGASGELLLRKYQGRKTEGKDDLCSTA